MTALAMLGGFALVVGLLLAATGLIPQPVDERSLARRKHRDLPSPERVIIIVVATLGVLVVTRWPVAAIATAIGAWAASSPALRTQMSPAAKAEALTVWAEMLRDATGTPRGIEGVLVATADGAPALIRPHAVRLAQRLPYEPLDVALDGLAEDLDHPVGDLVVAALRLSAQAGGRHIRLVLDDLANLAREEARMHRRIEVARARPRADMRAVLVIMLLFVGGLVLIARSYLEPYGTPAGQIVLTMVLACWGGGIWIMGRMARPESIQRFIGRGIEV